MTIDHHALACEVEAASSDDVLYGVVAQLYGHEPPRYAELCRLLDVGGALSVAERLVPAGHRYLLDKRPSFCGRSDGMNYRAQVYRQAHPYKSDGSDTPGSWAGSSARALTGAALRAMAADHSVDANKMASA